MARKAMGQSPAGLFGYSHMLGGFAGGQAEYVRVPFSDVGPVKIPPGLPDEQALFLSDIFPTGYMAAENCQMEPGDTVAIWGCGPVGQFAIQSAWLLGAGRVIAIDRVRERLHMAERYGKAETINFEQDDVYDRLMEMTNGRGPDRCIDAVQAAAWMHSSTRQKRHCTWGPTARTSCGRRSCAAEREARSPSPVSISASWTKFRLAPP
jgi:threonine dehydrogenase-like Zn-dependent dehydrogenase